MKRSEEMTTSQLFDYLIDNNYFTFEELELITNINGYNVETLNDCIYSRYGYHSIEQMESED